MARTQGDLPRGPCRRQDSISRTAVEAPSSFVRELIERARGVSPNLEYGYTYATFLRRSPAWQIASVTWLLPTRYRGAMSASENVGFDPTLVQKAAIRKGRIPASTEATLDDVLFRITKPARCSYRFAFLRLAPLRRLRRSGGRLGPSNLDVSLAARANDATRGARIVPCCLPIPATAVPSRKSLLCVVRFRAIHRNHVCPRATRLTGPRSTKSFVIHPFTFKFIQ